VLFLVLLKLLSKEKNINNTSSVNTDTSSNPTTTDNIEETILTEEIVKIRGLTINEINNLNQTDYDTFFSTLTEQEKEIFPNDYDSSEDTPEESLMTEGEIYEAEIINGGDDENIDENH
jgi:hypothetical protein